MKNLSFIIKSDKLKKLNLLIKFNSSKIDFLTFEAKNTFIYQQKAFTKALILHHFDIKHYI